MTLGEKIASARKEEGMTQEMLAEQLGVTRQAVAKWETGKALPGTANLFMLRELLGILPEEAALEEKTETREPDVQEKAETAGSLTAKQTWVLIAVMAILLWFALQFVELGTAVGLLLLLLILIIVLFLIATGKTLPGTANLFMLRQLLGIPLEAADMEATDLEGTTGTEKSPPIHCGCASGLLIRQERASPCWMC